jgi:hypothetical protein
VTVIPLTEIVADLRRRLKVSERAPGKPGEKPRRDQRFVRFVDMDPQTARIAAAQQEPPREAAQGIWERKPDPQSTPLGDLTGR